MFKFENASEILQGEGWYIGVSLMYLGHVSTSCKTNLICYLNMLPLWPILYFALAVKLGILGGRESLFKNVNFICY